MKIVVLSKGYEAALGIGRSLRAANYQDIDLFYIGNNYPEIALCSNLFSRIRHIPKRDDRTVIDALGGETTPGEVCLPAQKTFASEKVLLQEHTGGKLSLKEYRAQISDADFAFVG